MQIVDPKLKFTGGNFSIRRKTERIVIHHAATNDDVTAATVHQWHLAKTWKGIGYHYLIRTNGLIEIGRPDNVIGSHSGSFGNSTGIGICFAGNFMNTVPTDAQMQAGCELIIHLFGKYGVLLIQGHRDVGASACPGNMFPMDQLKLRVAGGNATSPATNIMVSGRSVSGYLRNGRSYGPVREILGLLGVPYAWEAATNTAIAGFYRIPVTIVGGVGYAKINDLAAAGDRQVGWDANTRTATII